ncbi:C-reactive protein 1.1-like [Exaiptasia diaphana]|uniref:Pentraxin (PTX) domain-containing protein n=1 Tax=Exaiptasia diaphana TaxID=2652724 RepID=A0A913YFD1_EXADI|nr:C-reactive protein 1.1-like [Exaiptasia diaphana]
MTWDSSNNGQLFVYVDGVQSGAKNVAAGQTIPSGVLYLGQEMDAYNGAFSDGDALQGQLTNVQMWSRVLSEAEVSSLASNRCAHPLVGNLIQWSKLLDKRSGQVTINNEPCQP